MRKRGLPGETVSLFRSTNRGGDGVCSTAMENDRCKAALPCHNEPNGGLTFHVRNYTLVSEYQRVGCTWKLLGMMDKGASDAVEP